MVLTLSCKINGFRTERKQCEYGKSEFATIINDCLLKEVVGHVPFHCSELSFKFFQFLEHHILAVATDNRVNRGDGFGLETRADYVFVKISE